MKIQRQLLDRLKDYVVPGKVVVIYGPRQVGKTTLVNDFLSTVNRDKRILKVSGENIAVSEILSSQNLQVLQNFIGDHKLLFIDEAQRIPNIGINLKLIVDSLPEVSIITTGSASFDLASKINEPLTGRKWVFYLYPVSYLEMVETIGSFEAKQQLEQRLIWGSYPAVITTTDEVHRRRLMDELLSSYLYKDILEMEGIRHSDKILNLLRLIAFQIGHEVSIQELSTNLALSQATVNKYLDLLEKVFVIFSVNGFSRNLRKEITKTSRYYFFDNGIRNALIQNYNSMSFREDVGSLWENFLMVERRKVNAYSEKFVNSYFWRTYDRKEIDLIEEHNGRLDGYEFKWKGDIKISTVNAFTGTYPNSRVKTVNMGNFEDFLIPRK